MNSNVKHVDRWSRALSTAMLLACTWAASTAFAGEELRSQTVRFQDLDLNTPEGVQALYGRIHAAAWRICMVGLVLALAVPAIAWLETSTLLILVVLVVLVTLAVLIFTHAAPGFGKGAGRASS